MHRVRNTIGVLLVWSTLVSGCGGGISADSCDDVVDVTLDLLQQLIDDVESQVGDLTVEELIADEGALPEVEGFTDKAQEIDDIAEDLGCSQPEISTAVDARLGELEASTDIGRFIINAIRSGGL